MRYIPLSSHINNGSEGNVSKGTKRNKKKEGRKERGNIW